MTRRRVSILLPLLPPLAACAATGARIAGTVPLPANATWSLEVTAPDRKDIELELWNRGPGEVTYRRVYPPGETVVAGTLAANPFGEALRWTVTADGITIELAADAAGANVGYTVRAAGSTTVAIVR